MVKSISKTDVELVVDTYLAPVRTKSDEEYLRQNHLSLPNIGGIMTRYQIVSILILLSVKTNYLTVFPLTYGGAQRELAKCCDNG